jgi:D-inositol-3-phosphate glycosyltransferase
MPIRRIALISYHTSPLAMLGGKDTGGMNVFVRETARELARRGVDVDVFTRSQSAQGLRIDPRIAPNARVINVPAGPEAPVPKRDLAVHLPAFIEWVCQFAAGGEAREAGGTRRPYDLIHSHYWVSGLAAEALRRCWGARFVHTFHTLAELKNQIAQRPEELESEERLKSECFLCATADRLTASTKVEERQLVHWYGAGSSRIRVVPPGVDTARFHPIEQAYARSVVGVPPGHRNVLFAGRIEPLKGVDILFRAVAQLNAEGMPGAPICVVVIGGDPSAEGRRQNEEMARLHALRAQLGLEDLITFLGARDQDTLQYYYAAADVLVMPSHYESFGMVALEAMACGTPVIASDVGGLSQLVRHNQTGLRVPSKDPDALARALRTLLTDEARRRIMGHRAACYAEDFSWVKIVDRLLGVYGELQ